MAKSIKTSVEILLVKAELAGVPEKRLLKSRHLVTVDLIWPKVGAAKKTASRQATFARGKVDFTAEPWAKRILFREEIDTRCGIAVSVSDALTVQKVRKYLKLVAKAALKEGADIASSAVVAYGDIAAAPIDALAAMVGTADAPKSVAQGVVDFEDLPVAGEEKTVVVPLTRPLTGAAIGALALLVRS